MSVGHLAPDDLRTARPHLCADDFSLVRRGAIERQVERQYVHPRLAKKTEGASLDMLVDELAHAIFGHVARFRNTGHLK